MTTSAHAIQPLESAPDTSYQESTMPDDNRKRKQVPISLSEAQTEALDTAAKESGKNRSEFVRDLLRGAINNFPDDLQGVGRYERTPKD